jgi:phage tail-like protein
MQSRPEYLAEASARLAALKSGGDSGYYDEGAYTATFLAEIDGEEIGRFTEVSGLEVNIDVFTLEEGGVNGFEHQFPGRMTWPHIVLKRGITETDNLLDWLKRSSGDGFTGQDNKLTRSTFAITLMSAAGVRLRSWNFEGAFPVKWTGPRFAVSTDELAEEELEIAHHGFLAEDEG